MPLTSQQAGKLVVRAGLSSAEELQSLWKGLPSGQRPRTGEAFLSLLSEREVLTEFQAERLLSGTADSLRLGEYLLLDRIGDGGQGHVFLGKHRRMDRVVAIKVLRDAPGGDPASKERFDREVRAAARLSHPNIVIAYDAGQVGEKAYLVMEYIDGPDLQKHVRARGPLDPAEAVDDVRQAALGLQYAHDQGVIHRDIKPANLLLDRNGTVKILDMGLARLESPGVDDRSLTDTNLVMGTLDFMSPEQAMKTSRAGPPADIYSLGVTLWYLLTGRPLYEADSPVGKLMAHRDSPIPSLRSRVPSVSESLDGVFRKMVAKTPETRYGTATELLSELGLCPELARSSAVITSPSTATSGQSSRVSGGRAGSATVAPPPLVRSAGTSTEPGTAPSESPDEQAAADLRRETNEPERFETTVSVRSQKTDTDSVQAEGVSATPLAEATTAGADAPFETLVFDSGDADTSGQFSRANLARRQVTPVRGAAWPGHPRMRVLFLVLLAGTLVSGVMAFRAWKESPANSPGAGETTSSPLSTEEGNIRRNVDLSSSRTGADTGDRNKSTATVSDDRVDKILRELRVTDAPEPMTRFVHTYRDQGVTAELLWQAAKKADEERSRANADEKRSWSWVLYNLLLSLGEFSDSEIPDSIRYPLHLQTAAWFRDDPSSAIHGASGWLLRHWGQGALVRHYESTPVPYEAGREWFRLVIAVDDQKFSQTYIVFPAGDYETGSPQDEPGRDADEQRQTVRLVRPFAILDREITRAEFEASGIATSDVEHSPTAEHPMVAVSWYDSVRFCRWWTEQAGMSESAQCYFDPDRIDVNVYPPDPDKNALGSPRDWPHDFNRRGFRLPTEAEWEIAARAGMGSAYSFGNDGGRLDHYGWFQENSGQQTQVPRILRPNLRGVFDTHGNAWEWCHGYQENSPTGGEFMSGPRGTRISSYRMIRGGGWTSSAEFCRLAIRSRIRPTNRHVDFGLRLALVPSGAERVGAELKQRGSEPHPTPARGG